jgi:hypothetical protein
VSERNFSPRFFISSERELVIATVFLRRYSPSPLFSLSTSFPSLLSSSLAQPPPRKKNKTKKPKTTDFNTTALLSDAQAKLSGIQEQARTFSFFIERGETERGRERERQRGRE